MSFIEDGYTKKNLENKINMDLRPCWQKVKKNIRHQNSNTSKQHFIIDDEPTDFKTLGKSFRDLELETSQNKFFNDTHLRGNSPEIYDSYSDGSFEKDLSFSDGEDIQKYIEEQKYMEENIDVENKKEISTVPNKTSYHKNSIDINKCDDVNVSLSKTDNEKNNKKCNDKDNYDDYKGLYIENGYIIFNHS